MIVPKSIMNYVLICPIPSLFTVSQRAYSRFILSTKYSSNHCCFELRTVVGETSMYIQAVEVRKIAISRPPTKGLLSLFGCTPSAPTVRSLHIIITKVHSCVPYSFHTIEKPLM